MAGNQGRVSRDGTDSTTGSTIQDPWMGVASSEDAFAGKRSQG